MSMKCEINFDNNQNGVYFAGQLVSGQVVLNLEKTKKLRAICLRISGNAQCQWTESESTGTGKNRTTRTVYYSGREDYVSTSTYLVPYGVSGDGFEIQPGCHSYTFACALPVMLPTSFEGNYGHIRYTAKVILERPWKFDHTYAVAFTVLREQNLNYMAPHLRFPTQMEFTKHFCCGPCRSAPITIMASVPQTGYVPGQVIVLNARVDNASSTTINCVQFMIRKVVTYYSQTPHQKTKLETEVITKHKASGVATQSNGTFQEQLLVPPVPATNDDGICRIISITYEVRVEAKVSGAHINPYVSIPIIIGTTPLTRHPSSGHSGAHLNIGFVGPTPIVAQPTGQNMPSAPAIMTAASEGAEFGSPQKAIGGAATFQMDGLDTDPPSYEETMNGNRQILDAEDTHPIGSHTYTPRYPVYNFERQSAPVVIQQTGFQPAESSEIQKY